MNHSVVVDFKRCRGCTSCIKCCPTEAIRVRSGKAAILEERCIDCGACILACPHHAIKAESDPLSLLERFQYRVAVPSPALYGQFQNLEDTGRVLNALLEIGFHQVYEGAKGAEYLSDLAGQEIRAKKAFVPPRISSACPAVLRLIGMRFPRLIANVAPALTPEEVAAVLARKQARERTGLDDGEIGVFTIVPCPAKVTSAHSPVLLQKQVIDGAFSIRDVYLKLLRPMKKPERTAPMASAGGTGISWASLGGESAARPDQRYLAVDGIDNVIRMLEEIEDGRSPEADFIELAACVRGCVGGCLTVENPFSARMRTKRLAQGLPAVRSHVADLGGAAAIPQPDKPLEVSPALLLDTDRAAAFEKMLKIEELESHLPGLLCGSCGAPSCRAFAEDVVLGRASEEDCIFKVRSRMKHIAGAAEADAYLPAPFRRRTKDERDETEKERSV